MALTIEILSSISKHIEASSEGSGLVLAYIYSEMYRLQHGPFTLAEAKDSRRPYKRQAWKGEWAENRWITAMDTGEHGCSYCDDTQPFLFFTFSDGTTAWVSDEDATACDYLLKPEGGE